MGLKKKLTKENMKGMSEYSKEKLYAKAADKYGIKYQSKSVGGRPGQYSAKEAGLGAKHAVNAAMEADPNFAIARAMGGTEGDKKSISHFADYKKQGKQANDGEFGGYKANAKVARNAFESSQQQLKDDILGSLPEPESRIRDPRDEDARELSDRGRAAIDAANYEFTPVDRGLGSPGYAYDPNAAIASDEAGDFMKTYKKDIEAGIGNVPGRGMMSLHNRF